MAEHSAVNRRVVGSSPTWGAKLCSHLSSERCEPFVLYGSLSTRTAQKNAGKGMAKCAGSRTNVKSKRYARTLCNAWQKITPPAFERSQYKGNQKAASARATAGAAFGCLFQTGFVLLRPFLGSVGAEALSYFVKSFFSASCRTLEMLMFR